MKRLELEAWSSLECELSHAEAAAIRESELVEVAAAPGPNRWRLISDSRVGVALGPSWELRVNPRLTVARLFFLLAYATDPSGWRDRRADFESEPGLLDAIASGFSWHALRAVELGLLRGYVGVEERLHAVRGRVRFGDQIARSAGLPLPVEVAYDEYTPDVAENRMLKSATVALLRLPRVPPLARRRLLELRAVFDDVAPLARPREAELPRFTRLNERYRPALCLARLILRSASLAASAGPLASTSFVFDMNRVFEDFLSTAMKEALRPHGGEVRAQVGRSLDVAGRVPIRPDLTWHAGGALRAVIDAKHKSVEQRTAPAADAYQMLAYCTALGLRRGYLVYAGDGVGVADLSIRNSNCEICVRAVDISRPPEELLGQVAELSGEVVREGALCGAERGGERLSRAALRGA
ncbi:MAG TPA: hypothetical protein VFM94_10395 [Solirubrobacterales bacterium]|nr:hypothetical protein [Solirubrobacterales bacterium]